MKKVINCYYVHKSNYEELSNYFRENEYHPYIAIAISYCNKYFPNYEVIKYDSKNHTVSCIESPDWNTSMEPIVGDSCITYLDTGEVKIVKGRKNNPQIYHNKWQFVSEDYAGFDVEEAKHRTEIWNKIPNLDKSRIGNKNYWVELLTAHNMEV